MAHNDTYSPVPRTTLSAGIGALLLTGLLFMVIPLSKLLMPEPEIDTVIREITRLAPPPPKAPPSPPDLQQPDTAPEPEFQPPLPEISLQQLQLSLQPGMSDALGIDVGIGGFNTQIDILKEAERIFTFEELQQAPHIISAPTINYPDTLRRRGITRGNVEMIILIDEQGRVTVEKILSSTHPDFEPIAREVARRSRFSISTINGEPVKVRGRWPLTIKHN